MYRRQLRMALIRDLESNHTRSEFMHRVASIPVVYFAWNIAAQTYTSLKRSNKLIKVSLTTTEKAALFVSKPVAKKFRKQLKAADDLACKGLDALQGVFPIIIQQQEWLYRKTKSLYDGTLETGFKKYNEFKQISATKANEFVDQGNEKFTEFLATPYGEVLEIILDNAFEAGDIYVDYYLPPLGDERPERLFGDRGRQPAWERAKLLKSRLKERFYKHSLLQIQQYKIRTKLFIARIYRLNLYEYLVEVSAMIPQLAFTPVVFLFSSLEDVASYLRNLFISNQKDDELV